MKVIRGIVVIILIAFCNANVYKQIIADSPTSLAEISNIINSGNSGGEVITVEVHEVDSSSNIPTNGQLIPVNMHPPPHAGHAQWMQSASNSEPRRSYTTHHHNNLLNSGLYKNPHISAAHGGGYWGSSSYGLANNAPQSAQPSYTIVIVEETPSSQEHKYSQNSFQNQANHGNRPVDIQNVYSGGLPNAYQHPNIYGQQEQNHGNRHSSYGQHQQNYGHQQPVYNNRKPIYWQQQPNYGQRQESNLGQQQPNQNNRQQSDENQKPNEYSDKHHHNDGHQQENSGNNHQTDKHEYTHKPNRNQQDNILNNPVSVAGPGPKAEINSTGRPLRENNVNQADTDPNNEFSIDIRTGFDEDYAKPKQ